jgi:hypothetical protein
LLLREQVITDAVVCRSGNAQRNLGGLDNPLFQRAALYVSARIAPVSLERSARHYLKLKPDPPCRRGGTVVY